MSRKVPKPYNDGAWSEARFNSFIKSGLRRMTMRWGPINTCKKAAWVERGKYKCASCGKIVPCTVKEKGKSKRQKNVVVDHIEPIVPITGFDSWDGVIKRMFCEVNNLQVLCKSCHDKKSAVENEERRAHAKRN